MKTIVVAPEELRAWRKQLRKSQATVAERAKLTQARISRLEKRVWGTIDTYVAINEALQALDDEQQKAA